MELSPNNYDFAGWATRSNQLCADGRTILPDAFKHHDGQIVPLIWNHQHNDPFAILGKALLHCVNGDVYAYCAFNDTESGNTAKELVQHGDVCSLSICANQLKHTANRGVMHGVIRELSLVVAGANPQARIESVSLAHGDGNEDYAEEIHVYTDEYITLCHSAEESEEKEDETVAEEKKIEHSDKTVKDVYDAMTDEQKLCCEAMVGMALKGAAAEAEEDAEAEHSEDLEGGDETMKHNVFDQETVTQDTMLTHADEMAIVELAKRPNVGSLKQAIQVYAEEKGLAPSEDGYGAFEDYSVLFPEYELLKKGEPETIEQYDQSWIKPALAKIHKSPYSRIRTRFADKRVKELNALKAKGYKTKGEEKKLMGQITTVGRTTDPQTIYIKDNMHRDDIIDVTDFDTVAYQWRLMRALLDETMVLAALVGDGREEDDPDKIKEAHIRPIWTDNDEYTIHYDVDFEAAKAELQGTNTGANFSDNYIKAEAMVRASLYSREKFKGTGAPDMYIAPHAVNEMLLARDLNGRRIYESKAELAKVLNVNSIIECEQLEGLTRVDEDGKTKKLVCLIVNLNDYTFGSTKGGEITKFEDFDMDFNVQKFMLETRLSGSLYKLKSAIAIEENVVEAEG